MACGIQAKINVFSPCFHGAWHFLVSSHFLVFTLNSQKKKYIVYKCCKDDLSFGIITEDNRHFLHSMGPTGTTPLFFLRTGRKLMTHNWKKGRKTSDQTAQNCLFLCQQFPQCDKDDFSYKRQKINCTSFKRLLTRRKGKKVE